MAGLTRKLVVVAALAFSNVLSLSNRGISRTAARPLQHQWKKNYGTSIIRLMPFRSSRRPDDFIEAEIVSQTDRDPNKSKGDPSQNIEILGIKKEKKEKESDSGGIFNRLASFFGQDEESIKRKARKKQLNTAIDKIFEGSGALGTVFGSLAKGVGGIIAGEHLNCCCPDYR